MKTDLDAEFKLCDDFLKLDQRNFHCWNYRRHVASLYFADCGQEKMLQHEFSFTSQKIQENFSNYSAFQWRSVYIQSLSVPITDMIPLELTLVENAIYTEPDDQSAWWYLQFLCDWARKQVAQQVVGVEWYIELLERQVNLIEDLLTVEETSKWALVSLSELLGLLVTAKSTTPDSSNLEAHVARRNQVLNILCEIDAVHAQRYHYLLSRKLTC